MMEKLFKAIVICTIALFVLTPILAMPVMAAEGEGEGEVIIDDAGTDIPTNNLDPWAGGNEDLSEGNLRSASGLGGRDPRVIASAVINAILGFLGIIAVVIILLGGFKWMTAGGNEDKVDEAKKLIRAGVIGLVIILAAWGIASFVVNSLLGATGAQTGTGV